MLLLLGCLACVVAGFVLGLMYAKRIKTALGNHIDG